MPTLSRTGVEVRDAGRSDLPAARRVLLGSDGRRVVGTVTFYADAGQEGFGWPAGWAGLRALGVEPAARGQGIGQALVRACLERARTDGAPVLCLHTAEFMTAAMAMYERLGFRRAPAFDFDAARHLGLGGVRPVPILGYRLDLPRPRPPAGDVGALYENPVTGGRGVVRVAPQEANGHLLVVDLYLRPGGAAGRRARPPRHRRDLHGGPGPTGRAPQRPRAPGRPRDPGRGPARGGPRLLERLRRGGPVPGRGAARGAPGAADPPALPHRPGRPDRRQGPAPAAARRRAGPGVPRHHPVHQPAPARPAGAVRAAGPGGPGRRPPRPRPRPRQPPAAHRRPRTPAGRARRAGRRSRRPAHQEHTMIYEEVRELLLRQWTYTGGPNEDKAAQYYHLPEHVAAGN